MRNPLQLVLDFLSPSPVAAVPPPTPRPRPRPAPSSVSETLPARPLIESPSLDTVPLHGVAPLTHPRANREAVLAGVRVSYLFQRVRRRSIGFVVGPDGLEVRAPKWVTLKEVELGLQERGEWVLRKWVKEHPTK
jgi:hypothetical protein